MVLKTQQKSLIAHLINSPNFGGPQMCVLKFLQTTDAQSYRHCVVALTGMRAEHDELVALYRQYGAEVVGLITPQVPHFPSYRMQSWTRYTIERTVYWQMRNLITRLAPSLLHVYTPYGIEGVTRASYKQRVPLVWTIGAMFGDRESKFARASLRAYIHPALRILCVSEQTKRYTAEKLSLSLSDIGVIYNGVDHPVYQSYTREDSWREALGIPIDALVFGTVGRLSAEKGHKLLIEAAALLHENAPETHFVIVGNGVQYEALQTQVNTLQLQEYVHFLGFRADIAFLLKQFDVFVLPSLTEGLGVALIEAISTGLPCVATDVGVFRKC